MSLCRNCGHPNDEDRDFCGNCGEYLRWEATSHQAAVPAAPPAPAAPPPPGQPAHPPPVAGPYGAPPPPAPPPPQAPTPQAPPAADQPQSVLLALRLPEAEGYAGEAAAPKVEPGGRAVVIALVRNQSGIVDNYDLSVRGLPDEWWTIEPKTVYLVPFGSGGGNYEQEVEVRLHPPRTAEAEARVWQVAVVARSRAYDQEIAATDATLEIAPYSELESDLKPEVRSGRLKADFTVGVRNRANAPVEVALSGIDPESACGFTFREPSGRHGFKVGVPDAAQAVRAVDRLAGANLDPARMGQQALADLEAGQIPGQRLLRRRPLPGEVDGLRLDPGERAEATLTVRPPRQIWIGRSKPHPFQVSVQPVGTDVPGPPVAGTFRQKPWLPWWLLIVIPLLIALIVWLLTRGTATATVPDLKGITDRLAVTAKLEAAHLTLGEVNEEQTDKVKPGTVLDQAPEAGQKVKQGSAVAIKAAVGTGKKTVPDLTGKTLAEASALLTQAGLQGPTASPPPADPATAKISSQLPAANTQAPEGSSVQVFFTTATTPTGATTPTAPSTATAPATAPSTAPSTAPTTPSTPTTASTPSTPSTPTPKPAPGGKTIPRLIGLPQGRVGQVLGALGLAPTAVQAFSPDAAYGTIIAQSPAPGSPATPGTPVTVTISLGYPDVLFDAGGKILSVGGARGQAKKTLVQGSGINREPVVTPDGKTLVFQRGQCCQPGYKFRPATAQIWAMTLGQPSSARPLTSPGFLDQRPAISPDGKTVAFIAENRGLDPDLCFARLDQTSAQPSCITDSSTVVDRPAWAPDGKSIVVVSRPTSGTGTELLQYTSNVASSPNAADWTKGAVITQSLHPQRPGAQVLSAAFSPDTQHPTLALTANWRAGAFILWLVPVNGGQLGKPRPVLRVPACELAWLPDGKALVVSQRGPKCDGPATIARVDPNTPGDQTTLTQVGVDSGNPVFTPFGR